MNDIIIFAMGCFVSLIVACAVGLLLWGAANEPRGTLLPQRGSKSPKGVTPETSSPTASHEAPARTTS